jgi:hypothetical protein
MIGLPFNEGQETKKEAKEGKGKREREEGKGRGKGKREREEGKGRGKGRRERKEGKEGEGRGLWGIEKKLRGWERGYL